MDDRKARIIDQFHKDSSKLVRTSLVEWEGQESIDVRIYVQKLTERFPYSGLDLEEETWIPTRKGLRISVDLLDSLIASLEKARAALEKQKRKTRSKSS